MVSKYKITLTYMKQIGINSDSKYLEDKLLLISINFILKTSHSCLQKMVLSYVFQVHPPKIYMEPEPDPF